MFLELIKKDFIMLDGAIGTMLQKSGLVCGELPETLNLENPLLLEKIHSEYINAGAQIICANTFGANDIKLAGRYAPNTLIEAGIKIAKKAACGRALVALDMGPTGQLIDNFGTLSFDEAYQTFKAVAKAGERAGCDLVMIETMSDLAELRAAILAVRENTKLPVFAMMTFEKSGKTFTGVSPAAFSITATGLGVNAVGVNCSQGPNELYDVVKEIIANTDLPVIVKANAGLPQIDGSYSISAKDFASAYKKLFKMGVNIIGGCCGTTPEYIAKLKNEAQDFEFIKRQPIKKILKVCSSSTVVAIDRPVVVGERLNPTGKKVYKEALAKGDFSYVAKTAIMQEEANAKILDLNVGIPGEDEKKLMLSAIEEVSSVCTLPLQIDSSDPIVLESALRRYSGKAIVNSVTADEDSLNKVLPIVKKYGAAVIGLTLDKNGIPKSCSERIKLAENIIKAADSFKIERENIIIDPLTLTAAAEQAQAKKTLAAIAKIKTKFKVKTALGISNISFGLPQRENINAAFLTMALENGLDLAIINPNSSEMSAAFDAFLVLKNIDGNAQEFILKHSEKILQTEEKLFDISYCIEKGLKSASTAAKKLLETKTAFRVIEEDLIPALDRVGVLFETGKVFLPQLIAAAEAAKLCFEEIGKTLPKEDNIKRGKILLATVKGDIHDIGKNIVKTVLENFGYEVFDLGKNVDAQNILDAINKYDIKLIGLSALMTTTVKNMKNTIELVKEKRPETVVMVGGAVLTYDYAVAINADFYGKDAISTARYAQKIFGDRD